MADIDPDSAPSPMPAEQPIAKPNGLATTAMTEWFSAVRNWMKKSVVDLTKKITTVEDSVDDFSAQGEIYFAAKAAPTGSTAAYGLYLKAGDAFAGFQAIADSVGGAAIGFTADQFLFVDGGTAVPVLFYSGGKFLFTGDVAIDGNLTLNGTINTEKVNSGAISQVAFATSTTTSTSVGLTTRAGSSGVLVMASYEGGDTSTGTTNSALSVYVDGVGVYSTVICGVVRSATEDQFVQTSALCAVYPAAGYHDFSVATLDANATGVSIAVLEMAR